MIQISNWRLHGRPGPVIRTDRKAIAVYSEMLNCPKYHASLGSKGEIVVYKLTSLITIKRGFEV